MKSEKIMRVLFLIRIGNVEVSGWTYKTLSKLFWESWNSAAVTIPSMGRGSRRMESSTVNIQSQDIFHGRDLRSVCNVLRLVMFHCSLQASIFQTLWISSMGACLRLVQASTARLMHSWFGSPLLHIFNTFSTILFLGLVKPFRALSIARKPQTLFHIL